MIYFVLIIFFLLQLVSCQDIITTIAGSSTSGSFSGDNGAATSAGLNGPVGIALDSSGLTIFNYCYIPSLQFQLLSLM
jgi:hypothetical protein